MGEKETLTPYQKACIWSELGLLTTHLRSAVSRQDEELVKEKIHQIFKELNELHLPPKEEWDH